MTKRTDKPNAGAAAGSDAPAGRELHLNTIAKIGPEKAAPAVKEREHPTLAARIAKEGNKPPPLRPARTARPAAQGKQPRFVNEEGHILEHVGNMGKLSKVTPAVPDEPEYSSEPKERSPTLAERFQREGMAAYGLRAGATKPKTSPKE